MIRFAFFLKKKKQKKINGVMQKLVANKYVKDFALNLQNSFFARSKFFPKEIGGHFCEKKSVSHFCWAAPVPQIREIEKIEKIEKIAKIEKIEKMRGDDECHRVVENPARVRRLGQ